MEKIRVLQFVNILDRGGTESFIFNNLEKINRDEICFDFLLTRDKDEPREDDLKRYNCEKFVVLPANGNKVKQYFSLYKKLLQFFKSNKYEIIHFESNPPGVMSTASVIAAWKARIPVRILHSHGAGNSDVSFGRIRPLLTNICRLINTFCCNYFLAPSTDAAIYGFGRKVASGENCTIIKNAINIENYVYKEDSRNEYRSLLGIPNNTIVLGSVGRISAVKNQSFMVDLFNHYLRVNRNAVLLIVGGVTDDEQWVMEKLKEQIHNYGIEDKVILFGECSDVAGIINSFDLFLLTSKSEALGIAAIEAQINGLSVLAASDGIPSEMDITGNVLWAKLNDDINHWIELMEQVKARNYVDLTRSSIQVYNSNTTATVLSGIYLNLYNSIVKKQ